MSRGTRAFSARFDSEVIERLERRGRHGGVSKSRLAERYVDEGLRMDDHPGIVFRDGPTGRRAALAGGPDVWEIMTAVRRATDPGDAAVAAVAEWLELAPEGILVAMRYYSDFPDEVDERIRSNEAEADAAEAAWRRERATLA